MSFTIPILKQVDKWNKIPVIDMKNFKNPYIDVEGKENAWLFFFTDCIPGYSLERAEKSGKAKYWEGNVNSIPYEKILNNDKKEIEKWHRIYHKYVHLNNKTKKLLDESYSVLFEKIYRKKQKILGVKFRGTDYNSTRLKDHYVQPDMLEMMEKVKKLMEQFQYAYLYLATEEKEIAECFQKEFGEKLLMRNHLLLDHNITEFAAEAAAKQYGRIESGINYIIDIYLLSQTSALLTSGNSGSIMTIIINGGEYENIYYVNKGVYK